MISRLNFFLNNHLKSLFISKFNSHKKEISKISFKNISIKLKFLRTEPIALDLKWLFFYFLTNQWPLIKIKYYFLRGKKTLRLTSLETILRKNLAFIFLDKLILLSLVNYENWVGVKKFFTINLKKKENLKDLKLLIFDLTIFWEFEFLSETSLKSLIKKTEDSIIIINFIFYKNNLIKNLNMLRSVQFPIFFLE